MPTLLRPTLILAALAAARASAADSPVVPADLAALLAPLSPWSVSSRVEASAGFKDNLLLSNADEERSTFVRGSADLTVIRLPTRAFDYSLLANVVGTHYFTGSGYADGVSTRYDARVYLFNEIGWSPTAALRLSLPLIAYYKDEAIDQSDEILRVLSSIKVGGANVGPTVRWSFHRAWSLEAQASGERKRFEGRVNDNRLGEGALRLAWKPTDRLKLRLGAEERWRRYERRPQVSAAGRELLDTILKFTEREAEARAEITWDRAGHWRTITRASVRSQRDNGSGYYNFGERRAGQEIEWARGDWLVRLEGTARRAEYHVQKVGFGSPPPLVKDEFDAALQIERRLGKRWTALASHRWERTRSNDTLSSYVLNEGLLGLRWSWDK